jgi:hypothetical protein
MQKVFAFHFSLNHFFMSQEFDIHRELWDYCDEHSRRTTHFYPSHPTSPTPSRNQTPLDPQFSVEELDNVIHFLDEEEKKDDKKQKISSETQTTLATSLDTPVDIWNFMNAMSSKEKNSS